MKKKDNKKKVTETIRNSENKNTENRYEIVLLEDDKKDLELFEKELRNRNITVYAFSTGEDALNALKDNPNIGVLLTDIFIKDKNGQQMGKQGYEVANAIASDESLQFVSIFVVTGAKQEDAVTFLGYFQTRVKPFSKFHLKGNNKEAEFDSLAKMINEEIENTPDRYLESGRILYREQYRKLWFSQSWFQTEQYIGSKAKEIVDKYLRQFDKKSLIGSYLTLRENPNENDFINYLIGRRVTIALSTMRPDNWREIISGETKEEKQNQVGNISDVIWNKLGQSLQEKINKVNQLKVETNINREEDIQYELNELAEEKKQNPYYFNKNERISCLKEKLQQIEDLRKIINEICEEQQNISDKDIQIGLLPWIIKMKNYCEGKSNSVLDNITPEMLQSSIQMINEKILNLKNLKISKLSDYKEQESIKKEIQGEIRKLYNLFQTEDDSTVNKIKQWLMKLGLKATNLRDSNKRLGLLPEEIKWINDNYK